MTDDVRRAVPEPPRCEHCGAPVQRRETDLTRSAVVLEAHPTEDGRWAIRYDLTATRMTEPGPQLYRLHACRSLRATETGATA